MTNDIGAGNDAHVGDLAEGDRLEFVRPADEQPVDIGHAVTRAGGATDDDLEHLLILEQVADLDARGGWLAADGARRRA